MENKDISKLSIHKDNYENILSCKSRFEVWNIGDILLVKKIGIVNNVKACILNKTGN